MSGPNPYFNPKPYIPASLSEINDLLGAMVLDTPTFVDPLGNFPERSTDSRFHQLSDGFGLIRKKLGAERYAALMDLAARAKALFEADPDMKTGQAEEGIVLLDEISDLIRDARRRRVRAKLKDDLGEVSGD